MNGDAAYSKDFIIVFNTRSLNIDSIYQVVKTAYNKLGQNDRIFINILTIEK